MDLIHSSMQTTIFNQLLIYSPLIATICTPFSKAHRNTSRPIRPKPLIPIFTSDEVMFVWRMWTTTSVNFDCNADVDETETIRVLFFFSSDPFFFFSPWLMDLFYSDFFDQWKFERTSPLVLGTSKWYNCSLFMSKFDQFFQ